MPGPFRPPEIYSTAQVEFRLFGGGDLVSFGFVAHLCKRPASGGGLRLKVTVVGSRSNGDDMHCSGTLTKTTKLA